MATIKAFRSIRPGSWSGKKLTRPLSTITDPSFNSLKGLKDKLEGVPMFSVQEPLACSTYEHVSVNIEELIKDGELEISEVPALYVYTVKTDDGVSTGLWTLTSFNDFLSGRIKRHELSNSVSVDKMKQYRQESCLDGEPILISYQPDQNINRLIAQVTNEPPSFVENTECAQHLIWIVDEIELIEQFSKVFATLGTVYLADGHQRCSAIESALLEKYGNRFLPEQDPAIYFSSLYISADQIRVKASHKVIRTKQVIDLDNFLAFIGKKFEIIQSQLNRPVVPTHAHHFGLFIDKNWYELKTKDELVNCASFVDQLDAHILNHHILLPFFGTDVTRGQDSIINIGGDGAIDELMEQVVLDPQAVGFTLSPASVNQLMSVAYTDCTMPAKTTWVEPKVPYGLLMYHFKTSAL